MNSGPQEILKGLTVILTYPENDHDELPGILREAGASVLTMPVIAIEPVSFTLHKDLSAYNWLVFTSKNAVGPFFARHDAASGNRIAALGPGTAAALERRNRSVAYTGTGKTAVRFAEELHAVMRPGETVLLVLGTLAPDTLQTSLSSCHPTERINVYTTIMPPETDDVLLNKIKAGNYDLLVVSSPSAIRNLMTLLPDTENLRIFSIGQTTTAAIRRFGMEPVATAADPGYAGLARTIIRYYKNNPKI